MPGGFLSGLLGGFSESAAASRKEAADEAEKRAAREDRILSYLSQSDDPEIKTAAVSGLLYNGPRKKGFLDNLFGAPQQSNPAIDTVHALIAHGKNVPAEPGTPVRSGLGPPPALPTPPAQAPSGASAAMPATSGAQRPPAASELPSPGGPPPLQATQGLRPSQLTSAPQVGTIGDKPAHTEPRVIFDSPEERMRKQTIAKAKADVEGEIEGGIAGGLTRQQALDNYTARRRAASSYQAIPGVMPDGREVEGIMDHARGVIVDQITREPLIGFVARHTASQTPKLVHGVSTNTQTHEQDPTGKGPPATHLLMPNGRMQFVGFASEKDTTVPVTVTNPDGSSTSSVVIVPAAQLHSGFGAPGALGPPPNQPPLTPVGAPAQGTPAPAQGAQNRPAPITPNPGPTYPPAPAGAGPAVSSASFGPPPAIRSIQTGSKAATFSPATVKLPDGRVIQARENKADGTLVDEKGAVIPGALKVPESAAVPTSNEQQTLDQIRALRPQLDRITTLIAQMPKPTSMMGQAGQVLHSMGQAAEYKVGMSPSDPIYKELIPLADNLKVLASQPYLHGIRNQTYVNQIQNHIPSKTDSAELLQDKLNNLLQAFKGIEAAYGARGGINPSGPPPSGAAASSSTLPPNYDGIRTQGGKQYRVQTDAQGRVTSSVEVK